jgi:hypothetical protein
LLLRCDYYRNLNESQSAEFQWKSLTKR